MITGVTRKDRWWLWAFLAWIILSLGPGLLLANKPTFIGYFPLLFVWSVVFWIISLILVYVLGYKLPMTEVAEKFDESKQDEGGL